MGYGPLWLRYAQPYELQQRSGMKNATFRQVKVFEAVARHLNYSRAAEELRMSQPGVSIHIKQLEGHAGLPLFEQLGKKIYLTGRVACRIPRQVQYHDGDQEHRNH